MKMGLLKNFAFRSLKYFLLIGIVSIGIHDGFSQSQELTALNSFKYAIVETLIYDNHQVDKFQISSNVRRHFNKLGLLVVDEKQYDWPVELIDNPCLGFHCNIIPVANLLSKYKVTIQLADCNHHIFYEKSGHGSGNTETDAFYNATEKAFYQLDGYKYVYNPQVVIEKNMKTYPIVGQFINKQNSLQINIQPDGSNFQISILNHGITNFKDGQVIGSAKASTLGEDLFNISWTDEEGNQYETIARIGKDDSFVIEQQEGAVKKQIIFMKIKE